MNRLTTLLLSNICIINLNAMLFDSINRSTSGIVIRYHKENVPCIIMRQLNDESYCPLFEWKGHSLKTFKSDKETADLINTLVFTLITQYTNDKSKTFKLFTAEIKNLYDIGKLTAQNENGKIVFKNIDDFNPQSTEFNNVPPALRETFQQAFFTN